MTSRFPPGPRIPRFVGGPRFVIGARNLEGGALGQVGALRLISFDDTIGEGPRSQLNSITLKGRRSTWLYSASSLRLKQNLEDVASLPSVLNKDVEEWWPNYKQVTKVRRLYRGNKVKCCDFTKRVYSTCHLASFHPGPEDLTNDEDTRPGADDGGDDDAAAGSDHDEDAAGPAPMTLRGLLLCHYFKNCRRR